MPFSLDLSVLNEPVFSISKLHLGQNHFSKVISFFIHNFWAKFSIFYSVCQSNKMQFSATKWKHPIIIFYWTEFPWGLIKKKWNQKENHPFKNQSYHLQFNCLQFFHWHFWMCLPKWKYILRNYFENFLNKGSLIFTWQLNKSK